jgi:CO dehydrogenase maturation factor
MVIAISGKGGVGKTTLAALTIRWLKERGKGPVLAVDADPNSNLNEHLGLPVAETIGDIREETQAALQNLPPSMTKEMYLSMRIQECIVESRGLDLLSMGRQEGPGCYCYINHLLRGYLDGLHKHYAHVVIDNEAGMEHLSRRTTQNVDALLVVSDLSQVGLQAAGRIRDLARKLQLKVGHSYLVLNRVQEKGTEGDGRGRKGTEGDGRGRKGTGQR